MNINQLIQGLTRCVGVSTVLGCVIAAVPASAQVPVYSLKYDTSIVKESLAEPMGTSPGAPSPQGNGPATYTPFWVDMVNAEANGNGGDGIFVAVLDTGLLPQWPLLFSQANIRSDLGIGFTHSITWDPVANDIVIGPLQTTTFDTGLTSGHGTHVTSTIVGYRFATATADFFVQGVAPKVSIIPVKVLDSWIVNTPDGAIGLSGGTDEMIVAGIRYVADLATSLKIKIVINMSLGGSEPTPAIEEAIDHAIARGVLVVASAGNSGTEGMGWPGAYPQVISAAAGGWTEQWLVRPPQTRWWLNNVPEKLNTRDYWGNNWQDYLEEFSSRPNPDLGQTWKELDVCTPGASIVGPYKPAFSNAVGYYTLWGTSMAAPHVTGLAATLAQRKPGIQQAEAERILKKAATGLPLASDGGVAYDPFEGAPYSFLWQLHDAGTGFLTLDNIIKAAK